MLSCKFESMSSIYLFTISFPYGNIETSFIQNELKYLSATFDQVIIVPSKIEGSKQNTNYANVRVDEDFSNWLHKPSIIDKLRTVASFHFIRETIRAKFEFKKIKRITASRLTAIRVKAWLQKKVDLQDDNLLYTFWLGPTSLGALMFKKMGPSTRVISRCHNFDLYGNEDNGFYIPFQREILNELDGVYPVSEDGKRFIRNIAPKSNCEMAIMGVSKALRINEGSKDGIRRILSCSYLIKRKRVDLILKGIILAAINEPSKKFYWTHFGDGPELELIKKMVPKIPENLEVDLKGSVSNDVIHNYYKSEPVDVFVNASTMEGTPVSIMEAISYGIPVLATNFGGNREVVEKGGGVLLPLDLNDQLFSKALLDFFERDQDILRSKAYNVWAKDYNSDSNYAAFTTKIHQLLE